MQKSKQVQAAGALLLAIMGLGLLALSAVVRHKGASIDTVLIAKDSSAQASKTKSLSSTASRQDLSSYFSMEAKSMAAISKHVHHERSEHGQSSLRANAELNRYFSRQAQLAAGKALYPRHQKGKLAIVEDDHNSYPKPSYSARETMGTEHGFSTRASSRDLSQYFSQQKRAIPHNQVHHANVQAPRISARQAEQQIAKYFTKIGKGLSNGLEKHIAGRRQKKAFIGVGPEDRNAEEVAKALGIDASYFTPVTPPKQEHIDEANQAVQEQRADHYTSAEDIKLPPA